jgi:outer membrane scaffolding protein for murein synthesis (MipA/OmpV family)
MLISRLPILNMTKLFALALAAACNAAWAQTPASNPMPDGSRDMFVGLGAVSAPRYEGAEGKKVSALPVLQIQWSNGLFVSGTSAGWHLSADPAIEFGPLAALQLRRSDEGSATGADGTGDRTLAIMPKLPVRSDNRLSGMADIPARLMGGGFLNVYLAPQWRLTSSVLYGAGAGHNGGVLDLGIQQLATPLGRHHTVSVSAGATLANRHYNMAFFGVRPEDTLASGNKPYEAAGGLKDAHLGMRWNWALSPSWMLTSNLHAVRLLGSAKNSPLVERPTNLTVSTAIAYRF